MQSTSNVGSLRTWLALVVGGLAGLTVAYWMQGQGWSLPGELEEARHQGIVSRLILTDYPKSRDLVGFILVVGLPIFGALCCWWPFRSRARRGLAIAIGESIGAGRAALCLIGVFALAMLAFWHETLLKVPGYNNYVGAWPLLGEQGATLAWIQAISSGGVFGRDFFALYGPMFVYPLYWWMELTGDFSALTDRHYKLFLNALAFAILALWLIRSLRHKLLAVVFLAVLWLIYPAVAALSSNTNILRSVLGIFVIGCVAWHLQNGRRRTLLLAGMVLGQSFLFAQEVAICALLATIPMFLLCDSIGSSSQPAWRKRGQALGWYILATVISAAPMTLYLVSHGAGAALIDSLVGYPRLVMLGFGGLPFPDLRALLNAFREHAIHYSVLVIYVVAFVACAIALISGDRSPRTVLTFGLTLFGLLLFRQALGRSGTDQTLKVMIPAVLISALWLDLLLVQAAALRRSGWQLRSLLAPALMAAVITANLAGGILWDPMVRQQHLFSQMTAWGMPGKFASTPTGVDAPQFERLKVFLDPRTANTLSELGAFLQANTAPKEYVYFFPNEAAYYFLLDRTNPTRYAVSYFASTYARQQEIAADLNRAKVRYVVVSRYTWRVDDIPEHLQIPRVVEYLNANYRLARRLQFVDILERIQQQ